MTKPKYPKAAAPVTAPAPQKEVETEILQEDETDMPVERSECRYVAFCTDDGVCPYSIRELMKKVRLQAVKDILELIKMEKGEYPTIHIDDEIK